MRIKQSENHLDDVLARCPPHVLELVESQATIDAMESDGVNRDSVKISVLDKEVAL